MRNSEYTALPLATLRRVLERMATLGVAAGARVSAAINREKQAHRSTGRQAIEKGGR
jgi:hypothetical protein